MPSPDPSPINADDVLARREELLEQGIKVSADELCRGLPETIRLEVLSRLERIEAAEQAVFASWGVHSSDRAASKFVPLGCTGRFVDPLIKAEGGMGILCVAEDAELGRSVAYKVLKPALASNEEARRRFFHEAEITSWLNHPGIVPVYGIVVDDSGMPAYATAFVSGRSLSSRIEEFRSIDLSDRQARDEARASLLKALIAVCEVIGYAHTKGIAHGDIKPLNILTDEFDATRLIDWGLAKYLGNDDDGDVNRQSDSGGDGHGFGLGLGEDATRDSEAPYARAGTLLFISRYDRPGTFASDIYALGMTLAVMFADPKKGASLPLCPTADTPAALWAIALKAMDVDRSKRYRTGSLMASDLRDVLADRPISAYRDPLRTKLRRWGAAHRSVVLTMAGVLTVAAAVGPLLAARDRRLRLNSESARAHSLDLTHEMLDQIDHVGRLQATLPGSREMLARAVKLIEQLAPDSQVNDGELGPVIDSYQRAGRIHVILGSLDEAAACFQKGADYAGRRFQINPNDAENKNRWADALRELGSVKARTGKDVEAIELWNHAVFELTPVASKKPDFQWTLAKLHQAIGNRELFRGDQIQAQHAYDLARGLVAGLVETYPDDPRYLETYADAIYNIGVSQYYQAVGDGKGPVDQARLAGSKGALREALRLRRNLRSLEPGDPDHLIDVASSLKLLGNALQTEGESEYSGAFESYSEAKTILESLIIAFPSVVSHRQDLAHIDSNLGVLLLSQGRIVEARRSAGMAVSILRKLVEEGSAVPEVLTDLGVALAHQAEVLDQDDDEKGASNARYDASVAFARGASITEEPKRRDALVDKSFGLLRTLHTRGFFKNERRRAALQAETAFERWRDRAGYPRL